MTRNKVEIVTSFTGYGKILISNDAGNQVGVFSNGSELFQAMGNLSSAMKRRVLTGDTIFYLSDRQLTIFKKSINIQQ